jgi:tRNA(fMet)-specific endonuclease VapC
MTRFLLDSNAVTDLLNRRSPFAERVEEARQLGSQIGTCEPIVAELLFGLELSSKPQENIARLMRGLSRLRVWPFDRQASKEYGRIAADLRRHGRPMQVIDMMLAAVAFAQQNCVVVTTDSDLSAVPGLATVNWMKA